MTAMQIAGSVLAIPVGLASAYSVYRANFSVDTTCQTLRANIISMLDKKLDPTTQRMLVRHDVETFEKTCRNFDPDAEAAFRTLIAIGKGTPVPAPVKHVEPKVTKAEPAHEAPKLELRAAVPAEPVKEHAREAVKEPPKAAPREPAKDVSRTTAKELPRDAKAEVKEQAKPAVADIAPLQQHNPAADAQWVDAVRSALTAHPPEQATQAVEAGPVARGAPPHALGEMASAPPTANVPAGPAAAVPTAPALPPPTQVGDAGRTVAAVPAPAPDHPVPPAAIPEQTGPAPNGWLSKVPFVGQVLAK